MPMFDMLDLSSKAITDLITSYSVYPVLCAVTIDGLYMSGRRFHMAQPHTTFYRLDGPAPTYNRDYFCASSISNRAYRTCSATFSRSPIASGTPGTVEGDEFLAPAGRVVDSQLSEHQCEGWLEGYLLTGRHGLFNSYEAFIRIVDSMFSQHAKWLKVTLELPWRRKIASLNYLLASHVWQQDHNGFTHQDPGFLDHVINKKADVVRVYLPADANCLLSVFDHCLRSRHYVNVVVAGKHALPQWLTMEQAVDSLHARASASGNGRATTRAPNPTS